MNKMNSIIIICQHVTKPLYSAHGQCGLGGLQSILITVLCMCQGPIHLFSTPFVGTGCSGVWFVYTFFIYRIVVRFCL